MDDETMSENDPHDDLMPDAAIVSVLCADFKAYLLQNDLQDKLFTSENADRIEAMLNSDVSATTPLNDELYMAYIYAAYTGNDRAII